MDAYTYAGTIVQLKNVGVAFGTKVVIRDVTYEVRNVHREGMQQGQVVALLGPSGVGKTLLMRRIAGLSIPGATCTGTITLGQTAVPVRAGLVGVVAQNYPLLMHRHVLGNLVVAGRQAGLETKAATAKALGLLEEFGLRDRADSWPAELSGGQRQRVAIAQQIMCSDHVMLADEPFSGLDPVMVDRVVDLVIKISLMDEFNTVIVVTHDVRTALAVADHVMVLGRDRQADGSVVPGAYIKHQFDLIELGLAWHPEIRTTPKFRELADQIRALFKEL
jgi:polar amino acid transport system ATP-binding protein/sulfate transport system ATP-binding protein